MPSEYLTKLDPQACAWEAADGRLWLLVMLERWASGLTWSWQLLHNGRALRGVGGHAKDWADLDSQVEAGRLRAWELIRHEAIMWDANHDCREVAT